MTQKQASAVDSLLSRVNLPADLRQLREDQLPQLADEVRQYLIDTVSQTGGHLAAGLGVVELTVALHYVFDTPHDKLVWDVGHQAYPHKILTGRKQQLHTLRQRDGLSGFLKRSESEYDSFGAGHSSTSISAALGMAVAAAQQHRDCSVVAVIGDAALTAGMAFEALNHAGELDQDLLVILNDNDMSISHSVGGLSKSLNRLLASRFYNQVRERSKSMLTRLPVLGRWIRRWEEHMKGMLLPGTLFEELGFTYIGPIDGHDVPAMVSTLRRMRAISGPQFLHVVTHKGHGFEPAENDPCNYHGVSPFDPHTGKMDQAVCSPSYSRIFGDWLCQAAEADERVLAITPAMCEGSGLNEFAERFPQRYFDVGIAEQHALTFAAGLAAEGMKPVVAIYSTFLQRAFDQLAHDVDLQNLDITLAVDRAGLVGADGPTHAGSFDLSFCRILPNMLIMAPAHERECRQMLQTGLQYGGPAMVRYPRGGGSGVEIDSSLSTLPIGKAELLRQGPDVALLAFGSMLSVAEKVAAELGATLVNMRFIKPLDVQLIEQMAQTHSLLVTLEENSIAGGAGSAVAECLAGSEQAFHGRLLHIGLPDEYVAHARPEEQFRQCGMDAASIISRIQHMQQSGEADALSAAVLSADSAG
ncbi:MAG: 1-deoxy-D-xylulose-5-phosphate synthase [gamma proteobacterium symbiont of Bathyaustriella thionipta]|nr:1-deoxy-D-xylulose-5-phosphate synthase [gamma proteobacterium symbiont of Bathyaustriella thionipta]